MGAEHHPDRTDAIGQFMEQYGQCNNPADLIARLKALTDGKTVQETVNTNTQGTPGTGLLGSRMVVHMFQPAMIMRHPLKQIKAQKPQRAGKQQMMVMPGTFR
jgi:hypothetical protein